MSLEKNIATLTGTLKFHIDQSGLQRYQVMLNQLQQRMVGIGHLAKKLERQLGIFPKLNLQKQLQQQQRLTREQFQATLQNGKLQAVQQQQALKAAEQQAKLAERQHKANIAAGKAAAQEQRNAAQQQRFSLQAEAQRLRIAQEAQRLQTRHSQAAAAASRASVAHLRAEQALQRANALIQPRVNALTSRLGVFGHAGAGGGVGAGIGGMLGGFSAAQAGALGLAAAFSTAVIGLKAFTDAAVDAGGKGAARKAQYNAIFNNDKGQIEAADKRFMELADFLGVNAQELSPSYTSSLQNMTDAGMTADKSQGFLGGLLKFAKGSNVNTESQQLILKAIGQSLSKGQLMSEEWKSQVAESLPGSNRLAALSWQDVQGGKLTGQRAAKAFSDDMEDAKIKGNKLLEFLDALGKRLEKEANRGGKLDTARNSHESYLNRRENAKNEALEAAYKYNDGQLAKSRKQLDESMVKLWKEATPFIERAGAAGAKLLDSMDGTTRIVSELLAYFNGKPNAFSDFLAPEDAERLRGLLNEVVGLSRNLGVLVGDIAKGWQLIFQEMEKAGVFDTMLQSLQDSLTATNKILEGLHAITEGKWEIGFKIVMENFKNSPANLVNNQVQSAKANPSTSFAERLGKTDWAQRVFGGANVMPHMPEDEQTSRSDKLTQFIQEISQKSFQLPPNVAANMSRVEQPSPLLSPVPTATSNTTTNNFGDIVVNVEGSGLNEQQLAQAVRSGVHGEMQKAFRGLQQWNPEDE
ncbi:tape measure protein [Pseudomonas sp. BN515]|uniref:tape measure protein n=1 Tax=Pseudomonas sp. BN515 TaxID=2567892 RepID=UPI002453C24C|nr:tape measure protein [Pseudomonas sp. BN515]MDH4872901.1 hypothetical protein [Pseudomonas sp. BN515]